MISTAVMLGAAFVAGVLIGVLLPVDAYRIIRAGRGQAVRAVRGFRVGLPVAVNLRAVGVAAVVVALLVNGVLGFLLIATRTTAEDALSRAAASDERAVEASARAQASAKAVEELATCVEKFQRDKAIALKARDDAQAAATTAARDLWADLADLLSIGPAGELPDYLAAIRDYRRRLADVSDTRDRFPYPDPERCRTLVP